MNQAGKDIEKKQVEVQKPVELNEVMDKLLRGEDITEVVDTRLGSFTLRFPKPRILRQIQMMLAARLQDKALGISARDLPENVVNSYSIYATLDAVVIKGPSWWEKLKTSEDCPDNDFIMDLFGRYLRFFGETQQKISGPQEQSGGNNPESSVPPTSKDVADGAFSGIAYGGKIPESERGAD